MSGWEPYAHQWAAWTRTTRHDWYWHYREPFFADIVPPPGRATLEIGCGEGRVARDLRDRGHTVTGIDASPTMVAFAREADDASTYVVADAAALPLADASFDLVVAYNSLMDIEDLPGALREAARVLVRGGAFAVCIVHPLRNLANSGSYFHEALYEQHVERDGLEMTFASWSRPLGAYTAAITAAGLVVERIREVPDVDPGRPPEFMHLRARRAP